MTRRGGFARGFATADGKRVMVAALTCQQFAELAKITKLGRRTLADLTAALADTLCGVGPPAKPQRLTRILTLSPEQTNDVWLWRAAPS